MEYTAVIRTLGKSGDYYQATLDSLMKQTMAPSAIIVYIAEGYPLPKETVGVERYVYVKKGMVAQRALPYDEVDTEFILFLDDDVYLPETGMETLYRELVEQQAQVISPCVFPNHLASVKDKIRLSLLGREFCRFGGSRWGYKVMWNGGFSYRNRPVKPVYESQTNAGPCYFCRKSDFLKINYIEESWLEDSYYAFPDDQVMYYKMYCLGMKVLTSFDSGIVHLDASSTVANAEEKALKVVYSEYRNKLIFWHRFLYKPERNILKRGCMWIVLLYTYGLQAVKYTLFYALGKKSMTQAFWKGIKDGKAFLKSREYADLPVINNER